MLSNSTKLRFAILAGVAATLLGALGGRACAGAYNYGAEGTTINAAYLVLPSANQITYGVPDPYALYVLSNRTDLRPANWTFSNPLGPRLVTAEISARYPALTTGEQVTPNMACYWQVDLDSLTTNNVTEYNFLIIHVDVNAGSTTPVINLTSTERQVLRQFVDMGGTLLIDGGSSTSSGAGLFADVQWFTAGHTGFAMTSAAGQRHPLLSVPYFLSQTEVNALGANGIAGYYMTAGRGSLSPSSNPPDATIFQTVVGNSAASGMPYIAAGDYGSGHIIITAANICHDISNPVAPATGTTAPGICTASDFSPAYAQDVKLLVNMISFGSTNSQTDQFSPRHTSAATSEFGGSLLPMWQYPPQTDLNNQVGGVTAVPPSFYWLSDGWRSSTTPAIYGNIAYVSDAKGYLHAFDVNPGEDLDGNGSADDSATPPTLDEFLSQIQPSITEMSNDDFNNGRVYDQVWMYPQSQTGLPAPISAPTVGILPTSSGTSSGYSYVVVEANDGSVWGAPAGVGATGLSKIYPSGTGGAGGSFASGSVPPAPTIYRGRIFAVQPGSPGTLAVIDLAHPIGGNGSSDPIKQNSFTMALPPVVSGGSAGVTLQYYPPAVASIPSNDGSYGGDDIVVTVSSTSGVGSLQLGALDETAQPASGNGGASGSYTTKSQASGSSLMVTDAPEDRSGDTNFNHWAYLANPYPNFASISETLTGTPGSSFTASPAPAAGTTVYTDYDLSSPSNVSASAPRLNLNPNVYAAKTPGSGWILSGSPCVTMDNQTVYAANGSGTSYIAGIQDQPTGLVSPPSLASGPVLKWRFALLGSAGAPFVDGDGLQYTFAGYVFAGSPVAGSDGYVYALAYNPTLQDVIVMCFNPNASVWGSATAAAQNGSLTLTQFDETNYLNAIIQPTGSGNETAEYPEVPQNYQGGYQFFINDFSDNSPKPTPGTAPPNLEPNLGFPMPLQSTATTQGSQGAANASASQTIPLHSIYNGPPMLNWWADVTKELSVSSPTSAQPLTPLCMVGSWLYFGGGNLKDASTGYVFAVNAQQISLGVGMNGATREIAEQANAADFDSFKAQVGQLTSLMAAGGRYAVAQGTSGIEGFGDMLTLVSDSNRLIAFNPDGTAAWSCDSTYQSQPQPGTTPVVQSTTKLSLARPATLAQLSSSDYLLADSGNDRCVRLDPAGQVTWELTSFNDPNGIMPPGQPNTLKQPTSCITWATANGSTLTDHYLVADTGNYRIVEVDDIYQNAAQTGTSNGYSIDETNPNVYHTLVWESHTAEQGRMYRYVAAQPYVALDGNQYVMAAVANKRVAPVVSITSGGNTVYNLQAPGNDSDGSSLVLLYYNSSNYTDAVPGDYLYRQTNGTQLPLGGTIAYRYAPSTNTQGMLPLITFKSYLVQDSGTLNPVPLRGVRFLVDYFRYPRSNSTQRTMVCDADGVFDAEPTFETYDNVNGTALNIWYLNANPYSTATGSRNTNDQYAFAFTQNEYTSAVATQWTQSAGSSTILPYRNTTFKPSSALLLPNQDYLITNGAATGDPGSQDTATVGGNIFEIMPGFPSQVVDVWGLPTNAAPVVGPAFAMRPF